MDQIEHYTHKLYTLHNTYGFSRPLKHKRCCTGSQNYHRRCFSLMNRTKLQLHWGDGVGGGERTSSPEG